MEKPKISSDFKQKLISKFQTLYQEQIEFDTDEVDVLWIENRKQCKAKANKQLNNIKCTFPNNINKSVALKKQSKVTDNKGNKQLAPTVVLSKANPIPNMTNWTPIQKNFTVEDENIRSNMPYMGDQLLDKNPKFFEELKKDYGGNIRGENSEHFINDDTFVKLIKAMIPYQSEDEETSSSSLPNLMLLTAMSEMFPSRGNPDQLRKSFFKLSNSADPNLTPNIDGPDAQSLSAEQTLHSFHKYFCRRCFMYGCVNHEYPTKRGPNLQKRMDPGLETNDALCGVNCFMLDKTSKQTDDAWTGSDQSLFRVLRRSFLNNYCAIAVGIQYKTCQQVYDFAQEELKHADPLDLGEEKAAVSRKPQKKKTNTDLWAIHNQRKTQEGKIQFSNYTPCNCVGLCDEKTCECFDSNNNCEKFCNCSLECPNRFKGCLCKSYCSTNLCSCFKALRECDPDLCKNCKLHEHDLNNITCKNVNIQRNLSKHLLLAPSDVAGWGIFLKDGAQKNEYISEYCGEIISQSEAERRGKVYDQVNCNYMFDVNKDVVIDATRKGNKIRFANHAEFSNCYAKVIKVNGDQRIGIFAKRIIKPGEELFISYGETYHILAEKR